MKTAQSPMRFLVQVSIAFICVTSGGPSGATRALAAETKKATPMPLVDYRRAGHYVSGEELIKANRKLVEFERGFQVQVPLDYRNPGRGSTAIYGFFPRKFDPSKPTFVFFEGGPGGYAHRQAAPELSFFEELGFNVLNFDQRGIGFSRFRSEAEARDARNYSSEATALDAKALLDKVGIEKVSIYGGSYGTIPATIFAHLFPERTTTVVLEGTVFEGKTGVLEREGTQKILQTFFDQLPLLTRGRIMAAIMDELIKPEMIPNFMLQMTRKTGAVRWPAIQAALITYFEENRPTHAGLFELLHELDEAADADQARQLTPALGRRLTDWVDLVKDVPLTHQVGFSTDVNYLLFIKEFAAGDARAVAGWVLDGNKVVPRLGTNYSSFLPMFTNMQTTEYLADRYPVKVPVFYLQGTMDVATDAAGATLHYQRAAVGPAQLLLFDGLGHSPLHNVMIAARSANNWGPLKEFFASLLRGEPTSPETLEALRSKYPVIKVMRSVKGFAEEKPAP